MRASHERLRLPLLYPECVACLVRGAELQRVGEIEPTRILPGRKNGAGRRNGRIGNGMAERQQLADRVFGDLRRRDIGIGDLIDEGAIGAVFEQAAHQIGQEVLVRSYRRIDAGGCAVIGAKHLVQLLAHAMQALEFVAVIEAPGLGRQMQHRRRRMGIVAGKLRIDILRRKQLSRRRNIADIGGRLAGEHRIARQAQHLRALDLGIPIGAFDQPNHDAPVEPRRCLVEPVDQRQHPHAIGLHHHAEAGPARQFWRGQHSLDDIERQVQPVGLFGVDIEPHIGARRDNGQFARHRHQFGHHPVALADFVARMQGAELDGNAGIVAHRAMNAMGRQGGNGAHIGVEITPGIFAGAGGFAQHVIRIAIALRLGLPGMDDGLVNGAPEDELAAHQPHGLAHRRADHRLAEPRHGPMQSAFRPHFGIAQHIGGEVERPGREVHQGAR